MPPQALRPRSTLQTDLVLTTRPVRSALQSFGLKTYPPELNVALGVPGTEISLALPADVRWDRLAQLEARRRLHAYYWSRYRPSRRRTLVYALARFATGG